MKGNYMITRPNSNFYQAIKINSVHQDIVTILV